MFGWLRRRRERKSPTIVVNMPHYVGSREELRRALEEMARRGQLDVLKRR